MRRVSTPPEPAAEALTPREHRVLCCVAAGQSNKKLPRRSRSARPRFKTHLLHIFAKLGVDDRTAAVTVALRRGLLSL